jgi:ABC-2 type transport system ATP-binding protein
LAVIAHTHYALEIRGLSKSFDRPAVDGLDLAVRTGEFYALLGPNGARKTTTLRMIAGLLRPDAGAIRIAGIDALADPVAAKRLTAWISDEPMTYDKLTPEEYLEFVAGLWGVEPKLAEARARELLDWLGLAPHARERCETFSKGMRQKVALAGALVHDPLLIILDEPLTGLDAGSARQVKTVLRERARSGGTVLMTTHILEVAERMADRIGVIAHGRLIAEGTLDDLRRHVDPAGRRQWRERRRRDGWQCRFGQCEPGRHLPRPRRRVGGSRVMFSENILPRLRGRWRAKLAGGGKCPLARSKPAPHHRAKARSPSPALRGRMKVAP